MVLNMTTDISMSNESEISKLRSEIKATNRSVGSLAKMIEKQRAEQEKASELAEKKKLQGTYKNVPAASRPNWLGPYQDYSIQSGGGSGGKYLGPFYVKKSVNQPNDETVFPINLDIAAGKIILYSIQNSGPITLAYKNVDAGNLVASGAGVAFMYVNVAISIGWPEAGNIDPNVDEMISLGASFGFIENTDGTTLPTQRTGAWVVPIASIDGNGKLTQNQYGNLVSFLPPWIAMYYCEMGIEKCMKNFGLQVACSEIGGGPTP